MAKDRLILVIICSAAILVAVTVLLTGLVTNKALRASPWQCLDCDAKLNLKTSEPPPIKCPRCGGQAVRVYYRNCPNCREKIPEYRMRLTQEGQSIYAASKTQGQDQRASLPAVLPMEVQFGLRQADDSYVWGEWIAQGDPRIFQVRPALVCPKCGATVP